jgi:hypothetical protein
MPIQYELDEARHRIRVISRGTVGLADTLAIINRQAADGAWSYPMLYDMRDGLYIPTDDDLHQLIQHVGAMTTRYGPRGPVAFVVLNPELLQVGQRYARLGNLTALAVGLFLTIEDAEVWLAEAH